VEARTSISHSQQHITTVVMMLDELHLLQYAWSKALAQYHRMLPACHAFFKAEKCSSIQNDRIMLQIIKTTRASVLG
jgi:hypothetical protein